MKKLIPAIALLVISSLLLSVASYAWFSMNTTVTATNMSVQATTSKNLVISLAGADTWNQSVDAATTLTSMLPVSTDDLENWFATTEQGQKKVGFNNGTVSDVSEGDFSGATNPAVGTEDFYYLHKSFDIKVSAEDTLATYSKLYVSAFEITGNTLNISKSLRVGVKAGSNFYIYAPTGGDATYQGVATAAPTFTPVTVKTVGDATATLGAVATTPTTVDVYIWYEGQDTNNTSFNALSAEAVTFAISFKAE